jgi:signal transduction histidine kinase
MRFAFLRSPRSLATQLLCTYVAALMLTVCVLAGVVWFASVDDAARLTQRPLRKGVGLIQQGIRFDSTGVPSAVAPLPYGLSRLFADFAGDVKYRILDRSGGVILSSEANADALGPSSERLFVTTEPMVHGRQTYYIQFAISKRFADFLSTVNAQMWLRNLLRFPLGSVALVSLAVYCTLRKVLKPLRDVSAAAAHIDARSLSKRLPTRDLPIEFLPLVAAFNLTLDRLEKGYIAQREFLTGAAHELKTPLALIRAQIEVDGMADRDSLLSDIDRMARQLNQLLHLAEASEMQNYVFESVDATAVAEDVARYLRRLAEQQGVHVDVQVRCAGNPVLRADRGALFMLLKNLVENAIQHSPVSGIVVVTIDTDQIDVRDAGPGMIPEELPKLFRRFWRGPMRRNEGAGLGLSICAEIAAAHDWRLTAQNIEPGAQFILSVVPGEPCVGERISCDEPNCGINGLTPYRTP